MLSEHLEEVLKTLVSSRQWAGRLRRGSPGRPQTTAARIPIAASSGSLGTLLAAAELITNSPLLDLGIVLPSLSPAAAHAHRVNLLTEDECLRLLPLRPSGEWVG